MYKNQHISLVLPCYNEENGLREVFRDLPPCMDEVIVVDNNSTDKTSQVARDLGATVVLEKKQGYGAAYKAGLRRATGDIIVTMDGDLSHDPARIPALIATSGEGFGLGHVEADRLGAQDPRHHRNRSGKVKLKGSACSRYGGPRGFT